MKTGRVWLTVSAIALCVIVSASAAFIHPHAGTRLARGEAYLAKGDTALALDEFGEALLSDAGTEALQAAARGYARALTRAGRGEEGESFLRSRLGCINEEPTHQPQTQAPDYVIEWNDPALETVIRAALDRRQGDIHASELDGIYDICILGSRYTGVNMLSRGRLDDFSSLLTAYRAERAAYEGIALASLSVLEHFGDLTLALLYDCGRPADAPASVEVIIE